MQHTSGIRIITFEGLEYEVDHESTLTELVDESVGFRDFEIEQIINGITHTGENELGQEITYNINPKSDIGRKIVDELNRDLIENFEADEVDPDYYRD